MKRADLLLEIGTEELPPRSLRELSAALTAALTGGLDAAGLAHRGATSFATPRRLAVLVRALADRQPPQKLERRGPPVDAAFDSDGRPTRAALAFAASCGTEVAELQRIHAGRRELLYWSGVKPGATCAGLLPGIVREALAALPIARRMRWGAGEAEFVRPVHWVVLLHGRDVVDCEILGRPAGRETRGHRFHAPAPLRLRSPAGYASRLESAGSVIPDFDARRGRIRSGVLAAAESVAGQAIIDPGLLDEVTALTEWPVPILGHFDPRFLELPAEILIATLQDHQRCFPLRGGDGRLLPAFIAVANIDSREPARVRAGNERVVRPRLTDAAFFYAEDRRRPLADRVPALATVTFQARLGSLADKTARVTALAAHIAGRLGEDRPTVERAAALARCDLLTAMVSEFPELQGIMGRYYAAHDGEPPAVATALAEQYLPRFAGDALPATGAGRVLALADRLDTIAGGFAIGQKPTGTRDPFGLRRAALGVLRILIEARLPLNLRELIDFALASVRADLRRIAGGTAPALPEALAGELYDYMMERLRAWWLESGRATTEMFDAVLDTRPDSPLDFDARLEALAAFLALPEAMSLTAAYKRIANILRKSPQDAAPRVDPRLLVEPAERSLATAFEELRGDVQRLLEAGRYGEALHRLAALRPQVDAFFDTVLVMTPDPAIRANRLALLTALQRQLQHTANLSRLPGQA